MTRSTRPAFRPEDLQPLFQPRHIAVIGASRTPGKQGHAVVRNLIRTGFPGRISPINPGGGEVEGLTCLKSLADTVEPIDCAMVVVPPDAAVAAVRECAEAKVKTAVVAVSGFAEIGTSEGCLRQDALTEIARSSGMRLVGPNTNGICNVTHHVSLGYNAMHGEPIRPGAISIISHSGALFGGLVRDLDRLGGGLSKFVPAGNEADLDMLDFLEYFIQDPATRVIGLLIEAIGDGERFEALARRAHEAEKSIVALKVGRLAAGVGAALAHSSRLAGSARAYDALFRGCGVASVRSVEALTGGCAVLASRASGTPRAKPGPLVCVATSGAGGAMTVDFAAEHGIALAGDGLGEWDEALANDLAPIKSLARIRNPIDLGSFGPAWGRLAQVYDALEKHGVNGPTVVYAHIAPTPDMDEGMLEALVRRKAATGEPVLVNAPGALTDEVEAKFRERGIPVFHDTATCMASLACHYTARASIANASSNVSALPPKHERVGAMLDKALKQAGNHSFLSETESAAILSELGLPMVKNRRVRSLDEARRAATRFGYPVVLKALAPGVSHKHKAGLVVTGIANSRALASEYRRLENRVAELSHARSETPFILQPMLVGKVELIAGLSREAGLGHFLLAGMGGVHTEILDEVVLLPLSTPRDVIRETLKKSRLGALLDAIGADMAGIDLLSQFTHCLDALSSLGLAYGEKIESVDINPCLITANGIVAVDALIVPATRESPI